MKQATDQNLQLGKWLGGAALGAVVMYMLDPDRGAPRRALSGEKLRQLGRQTGDAIDRVVHGAGNMVGNRVGQSGGDMIDSNRYQDAFKRESSPTETHRYEHRDEKERSWSDSAATRTDGIGSMLRKGAESVQRALSPSGEQARPDHDYLQSSGRSGSGGEMRGGMRGATLAGAGVLGLGGLMAPRSPIGMAMGLAGLALLVSASTRRPLRSMIGASHHAQPVEVEKTIRIDASPEQVFDLFANYENFPRFMSNVVEVRDLGNRRSHWVVKGPAGSQFAWNATLTEHSRPHRLAWESEPGAEVEQSGSIQFEPIQNGTRVSVRMAYRPPAGAVGQAIAALLGRDPKRQMDEDLARMKSLAERGAITRAGVRHGPSEAKVLH